MVIGCRSPCHKISRRLLSPRLFRLDAGQKNSIRVIRRRPLPADRGAPAYWLNIMGIPSIDDNASANRVEISINTQQSLYIDRQHYQNQRLIARANN